MKICAEAGYRVLDLNFYDATSFHLKFMSEDWLTWAHYIKELADDLSIEFSQAHSSFYNFCNRNVPDIEYWETSVRRSIICAQIIGIPWIVIHAGTAFDADNYRTESLKRNVEYFKPLIEFAAKHNVGLAIENLWDVNIRPKRRYTASAEELMELFDALSGVAGGYLGTCWDFEHADIMGQDQKKSLHMLGKSLKCTHVSDQTGVNNDHILPFYGGIDWKECMDALRDIGYQGDFTFEIHNFGMKTPEPLILEALKYSIKVGEYILSL